MQKKQMLAALLALLFLPLLVAATDTVVLPEGEYLVGTSIPEGTYTIYLPAGAVITIAGTPVDIMAFAMPEKPSDFAALDAGFDKITAAVASYNATINLCDEFDELLAILTNENHGLDSSSELDMKLRYYKVKEQLRKVPGGIVTAVDGELELFKAQVDQLRKVMTVLRDEGRTAMLSNLSQQSQHYVDALEDEKKAAESLQDALDRQSEIVQMLLQMDKGTP